MQYPSVFIFYLAVGGVGMCVSLLFSLASQLRSGDFFGVLCHDDHTFAGQDDAACGAQGEGRNGTKVDATRWMCVCVCVVTVEFVRV